MEPTLEVAMCPLCVPLLAIASGGASTSGGVESHRDMTSRRAGGSGDVGGRDGPGVAGRQGALAVSLGHPAGVVTARAVVAAVGPRLVVAAQAVVGDHVAVLLGGHRQRVALGGQEGARE